MKGKIYILCCLFVVMSFPAWGGHDGGKYLEQHKPVEFKAPGRANSPTTDPLIGIKRFLYSYDSEKQLKQIYLVDRTDSLVQYPCSSCHKGGVKPIVNSDEENPHARLVTIFHGSQSKLECSHCHETGSPDKLKGLGFRVPIKSAPKLCESCHSTQYKDWLQGAHGKRIGTWANDRVILSCTQCHNPHNTVFQKKQPASGPKVDRLAH